MRLALVVMHDSDLELDERAMLERAYGGAIEDCDFVVYFRKHSDFAANNGADWNGQPLAHGRNPPVKIDDPDDWKHTYFLFLH